MKLIRFIKWFFYWIVTQNARHRYAMGKIEGKHCIFYEDDSKVVYGSARIYHYHPTKKPEREYLTYPEYMRIEKKESKCRNETKSH